MKKRRIIWGVLILFCLIPVVVGGAMWFLFSDEKEYEGDCNCRIMTRTLKQPVDHGNPDGKTYNQEIKILVPNGAKADSPVFFILGNESDHTEKKLRKWYFAYGAPDDVIFVQAEHRGYGQSITDDDQSTPGYLRIDQALADYHRVVETLKKEYNGPWMAAGYSYGGGLVINFAYEYPEDVKVILASSAVVDWPFFLYEYEEQVKINLGEGLYKRLAGHIGNLTPEKMFDDTWYEREFLICMSIGVSQYKDYTSLRPVLSILSYLPTRSFVDMLRWLDRLVANEAGWTSALSFGKQGLNRTEALTGKHNWYTWKYQQCHETGVFHISKDRDGIFSKSEDDIIGECKAMFGEDPPAAPDPSWNPRAMIEKIKIPQVYVVGGMDPWKKIGLEPENKEMADSYIFVPDGFHCPDREDSELGKKVLSKMLELANLDI